MNRKQYEEGIRALVVYHPGTLGPAYETMVESYVVALEEKIDSLVKEVAKLKRDIERQAPPTGDMN